MITEHFIIQYYHYNKQLGGHKCQSKWDTKKMSRKDYKEWFKNAYSTTKCVIRDKETKDIIAIGFARCSPKDNFCRRTGRLISFTDAFKYFFKNPKEYEQNKDLYLQELIDAFEEAEGVKNYLVLGNVEEIKD